MKNKTIVVHVFPDQGGVSVYSQVISKIYAEQGVKVVDVVVASNHKTKNIVKQIIKYPNAIYHFEVGAGDSKVFAIARKTLKTFRHKQIITIHDTGQFVRHPLDNTAAHSDNQALRFIGKLTRKVLSVSIGGFIQASYLSSNQVITVYLRKDIADVTGAEYLPQPVYNQATLLIREATKKPEFIGYGGYWGRHKGLETIIEAWQIGDFKKYKLIVSGGTAEKSDMYSKAIRKSLLALDPKPELPGFVDDLDKFLLKLSVLLLPYWPELPSGTSAMALRAAELGVPIIASNTPALNEQLGEGPVYIEPKSATALVGALQDLEQNWDQIQKNALELSSRINKDHSWGAVGKRLLEIIEKTI